MLAAHLACAYAHRQWPPALVAAVEQRTVGKSRGVVHLMTIERTNIIRIRSKQHRTQNRRMAAYATELLVQKGNGPLYYYRVG